MSKRKRKTKGTAMNLEEFQAATGGPSRNRDVLPSAPLGEEGRMRRGRGRGGGGYRNFGGRDDARRGRPDNDFMPSRGDSSGNWRNDAPRRNDGPRRDFNRGRGRDEPRDGGFRDNRDEDAGPELNRSAFGTKRQSTFGGRRDVGRRDEDRGGFDRRRNNIDEDVGFDRSKFGTAAASTPPNRQIGTGGRRDNFPRRERDRPPPLEDDSREWRRKEPLRVSGPIRGNQDSERNDARSWRREEPMPRRNDREFGRGDFGRNDRDFGRNDRDFGRNDRDFGRPQVDNGSQDWRRREERRDFVDLGPPPKPKVITLASKEHTWNRKAVNSPQNMRSSPSRRSSHMREPMRRFGPGPETLGVRPVSPPRGKFGPGKFGGTSSGFGADILAQFSPTLVTSAEFHSAGTTFGRSRLNFNATTTLDPPVTNNRSRSERPQRGPERSDRFSRRPSSPVRMVQQEPAPEYPSLPKNKGTTKSPVHSVAEKRLLREANEQKEREKAEERQRKKEENRRKLKIKEERIAAVKAHLTESDPNFLEPLSLAVLRTGTMTLELSERAREAKKQIKNLALLMVSSILSPEHEECTFRKVLRVIETRDIDEDHQFSLLVLVLKHLCAKAGELRALELIGKSLGRVLVALDCDQEDPRDSLEDLDLRYLAPRLDIEAMLNDAFTKELSPSKLIKILHQGERQGESVDPAHAEKLMAHLFGRLFSPEWQNKDISLFFDDEIVAALEDIKNFVKPIPMLYTVVQSWFEDDEKIDLKQVLLATVEKEILEKQDMLDFQDDIPKKGSPYAKSKRASLFPLTSWFNELNEELNPPEEYSDDEEEGSSDEEGEEEEEESDEE